MKRFTERSLERRLRQERPQPSVELMQRLGAQRRPASGGLRLAFAGMLTASLLVMLAAVGGVGYAASAARQAVHVVKRAVAPQGAVVVQGLRADGDQYRPGFGFGDPNHNHTGPPGLDAQGESGAFVPPVQGKTVDGGKAVLATTTVTLDEQAKLTIKVLRDGKPILLTQKGTKIGSNTISGPQTKAIQYTMLVPRPLSLSLRVPSNLVKKDAKYFIQVIAVDPQGNKSTLKIPFNP